MGVLERDFEDEALALGVRLTDTLSVREGEEEEVKLFDWLFEVEEEIDGEVDIVALRV